MKLKTFDTVNFILILAVGLAHVFEWNLVKKVVLIPAIFFMLVEVYLKSRQIHRGEKKMEAKQFYFSSFLALLLFITSIVVGKDTVDILVTFFYCLILISIGLR